MIYDIVEIGTSDFRIDSLNSKQQCLLIEPVKFYLDRIENRTNIEKLNVAISNVNSIVEVFYTNLEFLEKNKLPNWLRGCNSISKKHPSVVTYCKENNINQDDLIQNELIKTITPDFLFDLYDIEHINYLKIDTEGHDLIILNSLFDSKNMPIIEKIKFESNILTNEKEYTKFINRIKDLYKVERLPNDTILTRIKQTYTK